MSFKKPLVETKAVSLLSNDDAGDDNAAVKSSSEGQDNKAVVVEKKARFADSVVTHEYEESESDVRAKAKTVTRAANAQEEVEKVENECKQS